jgi:hypothetical protein
LFASSFFLGKEGGEDADQGRANSGRASSGRKSKQKEKKPKAPAPAPAPSPGEAFPSSEVQLEVREAVEVQSPQQNSTPSWMKSSEGEV